MECIILSWLKRFLDKCKLLEKNYQKLEMFFQKLDLI